MDITATRTHHTPTYSTWTITRDAKAIGYISNNNGRVTARITVAGRATNFTGTDVKAVAAEAAAAYRAAEARKTTEMPAGWTPGVRAA